MKLTSMNTPRLLFVTACLWAAVSTARAATVVWDGGGGNYSWQNATNWDGDAVPGPDDDVVINVSSNLTVSSSADVTVKSLQCSNDLAIVGGTFGVTANASIVQGALTMSSGTALSASGGGTSLTAIGPDNVDGSTLYANGGATLSLPALRSYLKDGCAGTTLQASGAGSVLALPALTNLVAATPSVYGCAGLSVQALAGGQVLLTSLMNLDGTVSVLADGTNSVVDLSQLTAVTATNGTASFTAQNGGTVLMPALVAVQYASLNVSGGSVLSLPALRSYLKDGCAGTTLQASGAGSVLA
ncbi:MAG: hypothetical protein HOP33_03465, partial [Verrucomicrobia bacterium]|nr:hypothetical protein [Verrucomicrobiota bacterium]